MIRDYILSMGGYPRYTYHGTLRGAKKECRVIYKDEMKTGRRVIIQTGGEVISEHFERGWIDYQI